MPDCRLIYKSIAKDATLDNEALAAIEQTAINHNGRNKITGLLVLSGNQFLQVLEGESSKVNELYSRIVTDPRHEKVELISFEPIAERYFDAWAMRLVDLYDLPRQPREFLMKKYAFEHDAVLIPTQLNLVYSLLLDARTFCLSEPWTNAPASA